MKILLIILVALISYNLLKIFVLSNVKVNKWIVLVLFLIISIGSFFIKVPMFVLYIIQWLYFVLILWFTDLFMDDRREKLKRKNVKVIKNRAKPKPNRAKMDNK